MKYIVLYMLIVVTGYGFAMAGPWWLPILPCFVLCAWKADNGWFGFLTGALALLTLWLGSAWMTDVRDTTGLAEKIGQLFGAGIPLSDGVSGRLLVFVVTGFVSFLLGGLAGLAGVLVRR